MLRLVATLLLFAGIAQAAVFGPTDDRRPLSGPEAARLGLVVAATAAGPRAECTGALVGRREVLTNAHCVFDETGTLWGGDIRFYPNPGDSHDYASVVEYVTHDRDWSRLENDWVLLRLAPGLTEHIGYFEVRPLDDTRFLAVFGSDSADKAAQARLLAYHGDIAGGRRAMQSINCGARGRPPATLHLANGKTAGTALFLHDCDHTATASGGPLIAMVDGRPAIVAINSTYTLPADAERDGKTVFGIDLGAFNIAVPASLFADTVSRERTP